MRWPLVALLGLLALFCYLAIDKSKDVVQDTAKTNLKLTARKGMDEKPTNSNRAAEITNKNIQLKTKKFRFLKYNRKMFKKGMDETPAYKVVRSSDIRDYLKWMKNDLSELQIQGSKGNAVLEKGISGINGETLRRRKRNVGQIFPLNCTSSLLSCKERCMNQRDAGGTQKLRCSCDPYCDYFMDCCADYVQYCLGQRSSNTTKTAMKVPDEQWTCRSGIWMIASCPQGWTNQDINQSCISMRSMTADNYKDVLPVVTADNKTYANRFCARCHGYNQHKLEYYNLYFKILLSAPSSATDQEKINFLFKYADGVTTKPSASIPRRYCYEPTEKCTQKSVSNEIRGKCENGTFGLVYDPRSKGTFKNIYCGHCNYVMKVDALKCGPGKGHESSNNAPGKAKPFSLVMDFGSTSDPRPRKTWISCPKGRFYDVHLETCRKGQRFVPVVSKAKKYYVGLWMKIKGNYPKNLQLFDEQIFTRFFSQALVINSTTVTSVKITCLDSYKYLYFIEFNLDISEYKSNTSSGKESHSSLPALLHEKNLPFVLKIIIFSFDVIRVTSYPLTCSQADIFSSNEYYPLQGPSSSVYVNKTGEVLTTREYFSNASKMVAGVVVPEGEIVVCRPILTRNCSDGAFIFLQRQEYTIYSNRSVLYRASGHLYEHGTYTWKNGTIMICTNYTATYQQRSQSVTDNNHKALTILTYIGFCISVVCLLFVLVTYSVFADLRTIPGINLMNLCSALLVAQLLWLVGSGLTFTRMGCMVIAIVLHYSFLASFWWMSIIAFSTWRAFSGKASMRNYRNERRQKQKRIVRTMAMGWLPLVMYVSICVALDTTETVAIGYGGEKGCWINNPRANLFFFAIPVGLSILWNAVFFVLIIKEIKKAIDQSQMVARQHQARQNSAVYARIAVLMGFTWVFGFVAPFTSYYLMYPFVILNTLQGLYIAVAFGFNRRVRALYGNIRKQTNDPNERQPTRSSCTNNTKL